MLHNVGFIFFSSINGSPAAESREPELKKIPGHMFFDGIFITCYYKVVEEQHNKPVPSSFYTACLIWACQNFIILCDGSER